MKVSKWGNSLAIRLPAERVAELGLKEGDEVEAQITLMDFAAKEARRLKIEEAFKVFEKIRAKVQWPVDYKFDRDEANSRD